jgi:hypothetical protein
VVEPGSEKKAGGFANHREGPQKGENRMTRNRVTLVAVMLVAGLAADVRAGLVDFVGMGKKRTVEIFHEGSAFETSAGEIKIKLDGVNLTAFCVDLHHAIKSEWTADQAPVTSIAGGLAAAFLYDTFRGAITNDTQAAALQIAIWEVVEDMSSSLNLSSGNFRLFNSSSVRTQANAYLAALPDDLTGYTTSSYILASGPNPRSQNLIVPEPGTAGVLALGLVAIALRRMRRLAA